MDVKNDNDLENKVKIKEDNKDENQENSRNGNKENYKRHKEENKDDNQEKNKIENNDINKNENKNINIKDIIRSENEEDGKNSTNNNLYLSTSFQIINEINLNINDNIKIEENKKEEIENLNSNNILGDIFRNVVKIKSKHPKENLKVSLYIKNLDNEPKDFGSIIKTKLNEIKQNTLNYFNKAMKELDKRYNEYIKKINKYINENELKMGKFLENQIDQIENENILDFADNHIFEKFENIFEIHQNIFDSIEEHINLLKLLLEQINLIQEKNPLECYINNNSCEILNSWFLNKIDYQKLNLSNIIINKYLSDLCSLYLCKKKENNFSSITINKGNKKILPIELSFVKENLENIKKMKFIQMKNSEINSLFKMTNENLYRSQTKAYDAYHSTDKLSSLTLIDSDLSSSDLNKINSTSLIKLKLKRNKSSLDNQSLSEVLEFLSDTPKILESLQFLSFSGNDITKVDLTNNLIKKQCVFKNLKYIDCSKNNIYVFSQENFQVFPELKVLDLTDNNMSNHLFFDNIRKIPDNLFLYNNQINTEDYTKYLNDKLMKFNHKIKKLDFSLLFNRKILNKLIDLKFSLMIKISLIKLNLSYCGLDNISTFQFLHNNFGLINLKELNLSNNFITIEIFSLMINEELFFDNLYSIDLSNNNINSVNLDNYKQLELFIQLYSQLKKIKLQGTFFLQQLLCLFLNQDFKEEILKINIRLSNKGFKFIVETKNWITMQPLESVFDAKDKEIDEY